MIERFRRTWSTRGLTAEGWTGVATETPDWTATVVATWRPPTIDWGRFAATVFLVALTILAVFQWRDRGGLAVALPAILGAALAWDALRQLKGRRPVTEVTLVLGPDALEIRSSEPGATGVRLPRDRCGWLVAGEVGTDWHVRRLQLVDADDREVAHVVGSLANVQVRQPGQPPATMIPAVVPVAVLLGEWWPWPARRISRGGSMAVPFRWREPDLGGFAAHERRQRVQWTVLYGAFAALFVWAALAGSSAEWLRLPLGLAAAAIVAWRVRVLMWRPTFVQSA